jgi:hypothetical protein
MIIIRNASIEQITKLAKNINRQGYVQHEDYSEFNSEESAIIHAKSIEKYHGQQAKIIVFHAPVIDKWYVVVKEADLKSYN